MRTNVNYAEAIKLALSGNELGYSQLYQATYQDKYYIALKYMKNDEAAQDVLQDAYIKAFSKLNTLEDPSKFPAWLGMIVANTAKNELEKKQLVLFSDLQKENDEGESLEFDIEDKNVETMPELKYEADETKALVRELIDSLNDEQRMCVLMFHMEDMSIKEIAETLGCNENTVKSRLNYGRKALKTKCEELEKKGYKFYSVAPITLLFVLIGSEKAAVSGTFFPPIYGGVMAAVKSGGATISQAAGSFAAQTASQVGVNAGTQGVAASGAGFGQGIVAANTGLGQGIAAVNNGLGQGISAASADVGVQGAATSANAATQAVVAGEKVAAQSVATTSAKVGAGAAKAAASTGIKGLGAKLAIGIGTAAAVGGIGTAVVLNNTSSEDNKPATAQEKVQKIEAVKLYDVMMASGSVTADIEYWDKIDAGYEYRITVEDGYATLETENEEVFAEWLRISNLDNEKCKLKDKEYLSVSAIYVGTVMSNGEVRWTCSGDTDIHESEPRLNNLIKPEITMINPFDYFKIEFDGISPNVKMVIPPSGDDMLKDIQFEIKDEKYNYKNGDEVTVLAKYADSEADYISKYNQKIEVFEQTYAVSGFPEYDFSLGDISENCQNELNEVFLEKVMNYNAEHNGMKDAGSITSCEPVGMYLITRKPEPGRQVNNYYCIVFKLTADMTGLRRGGDGETIESGTETFYSFYAVENVTMSPDSQGEMTYNLEDGFDCTHTIESDFGYWGVLQMAIFYDHNGYKTIEDLYNHEIRVYEDNYNIETNL